MNSWKVVSESKLSNGVGPKARDGDGAVWAKKQIW